MSDEKPPVALIFFNRKECTLAVLARILEWRPTRLFLVSDGPRASHEGEAVVVHDLRRAVESMCEGVDVVTKIYSDENLGCARRVSSGITAVFAAVEMCVFLEDDCLPSAGFLPFASAMLHRYRDEPSVMAVGGTFLPGRWRRDFGYGFSSFPMIWGWAAWRRSWAGYDLYVKDVGDSDLDYLRSEGRTEEKGASEWRRYLQFAKGNPLYTWDYQFIIHVVRSRGICVHPYRNLISNIGYGSAATHTTTPVGKFARIPAYEGVDFSKSAPVRRDARYDRFLEREYFHDCMTFRQLLYGIQLKTVLLLGKLRGGLFKRVGGGSC